MKDYTATAFFSPSFACLSEEKEEGYSALDNVAEAFLQSGREPSIITRHLCVAVLILTPILNTFWPYFCLEYGFIYF